MAGIRGETKIPGKRKLDKLMEYDNRSRPYACKFVSDWKGLRVVEKLQFCNCQ